MPKNLATPKKCGKIKETPFLNSFKVSDSESEVRILIKILVLKLSKLMTLFVRNCTSADGAKGGAAVFNSSSLFRKTVI